MEETHLQNCHIGGEKLDHLLADKYYWPTMRNDCLAYPSKCFECQLSSGQATGSWAGKLLPLPPGPRVIWAADLVTNVGPPGETTQHLLNLVDCYSKFCLICLLPDRTSATVASAL